MSVMTWPARRNPAIVTGITGALLGMTFGTAVTWVAITGSRDAAATDDATVVLTADEVFDALRQHARTEYGTASIGLSAQTAAQLRQDHMAREYGAAAIGAGAPGDADLLFEHTLRESGGGARPSIATLAFEHTLRENGMR